MEFYLTSVISSFFGDISYLFEFPRSIIYPAVFILLLIAFNPKYTYDAWRLYQALERGGELSPRLADFPIHPTSIEKYLNVKEKIEQFKYKVLRGEGSQIALSSDDLNDLYLQGISINKYHIDWQAISIGISFYKYRNCYTYFEITNNDIMQKKIEYVEWNMPNGIRSSTNEINFQKLDNNTFLFKSQLIEVNGKKAFEFVRKSTMKEASIKCCDLLENIFKCDFDFSMDYLESNEYQLILEIIEKLTNIEISNGCLNIEFEQAL
jgi:hypothetical protein